MSKCDICGCVLTAETGCWFEPGHKTTCNYCHNHKPKFKVGDKVKIVNSKWTSVRNLIGETFTITKINPAANNACKLYAHYSVEPCFGMYLEENEIIGVEDEMKKFTKKDLKNGDVVLKRDGDVKIVCVDTGTLICDGGSYSLLSDIADDLTYYDKTAIHTNVTNPDFDIVAVRRPNKPGDCSFSAFAYKRGTLVYERKEEPEEMTLEEVCKALGKEIKIVKK